MTIRSSKSKLKVQNISSDDNELFTSQNPGNVNIVSSLPVGANIIGSIKLTDGTNALVVNANGSVNLVPVDSTGAELFSASNPGTMQLSGSTVEEKDAVFNTSADAVSRLRLLSDIELLTIPTYEESGQGVHPSVLDLGSAWNGYRYWMAFTPYPAGDVQYENPSILASNDAETWVVPAGLTNPIDGPPASGYFSDTFLMYTGEKLRCYYRQVPASGNKVLFYKESEDGVTWGSAVTCTLSDYKDPVSPSVVQKNTSEWYLYIGSAGNMYRATSTDGAAWGLFELCRTNVNGNFAFWHPEVRHHETEYRMVVAGYDVSKEIRFSYFTQVYYATSKDGLNWHVDTIPCVSRNTQYYGRRAYKASAVITGNDVLLYTSGQAWDGTERIGFANAKITSNTVSIPNYSKVKMIKMVDALELRDTSEHSLNFPDDIDEFSDFDFLIVNTLDKEISIGFRVGINGIGVTLPDGTRNVYLPGATGDRFNHVITATTEHIFLSAARTNKAAVKVDIFKDYNFSKAGGNIPSLCYKALDVPTSGTLTIYFVGRYS